MKKHILEIPITAPPWPGVGKRLETLCRKALHQFDLLEGSDKVGVALSGGKDSLALLFLLHAIQGRGFPELKIYAFHVEGEYSCGAGVSKKYLEGICNQLDVPLITCLSKQTLDTLECYRCSRERRSLIFEAAKKEGVTLIALGHHRDDSIQTLMMNLLHKGEFADMLPKVPMLKYGVTLIRPLIHIPEQLIIEFARQHKFARVTCQCPLGSRSNRKKTDELINLMEDVFPHARKNLASAGLNYASDKALKP